ncbi:MAG: cytochrome c oxidase assembly protein [Methylococcaceae bacterium]|nr:cytochrome c oxidase assembly protein [Methylococcaceae bacterium]MCI0668319.1 cytochrome c oxidase assembly protein [Methylococcaceae bacterium]MCI0732705.1 cytochrome c oxidase assembly protein [Methylococcaceae bacterium]
MSDPRRTRNHGPIVAKLVLIAALMFGFGFALVPLYDVFCDITGLNGKLGNQAAPDLQFEIDAKREISLEFLTSVNGNAPIGFRAETAKMKIHPGQAYTVYFLAENLSDRKLVGQAIPSFAPGLAARYLKKTECFCFSSQTFEAHETKKMPVRFVMDPALPKGYRDVTLAYTFFNITDKKI